MASIVFFGSFLAGSLLSLLLPVGLLIAIAIWHTRAIMRIPRDPVETAPHAAGTAESESGPDRPGGAPRATQP